MVSLLQQFKRNNLKLANVWISLNNKAITGFLSALDDIFDFGMY